MCRRKDLIEQENREEYLSVIDLERGVFHKKLPLE